MLCESQQVSLVGDHGCPQVGFQKWPQQVSQQNCNQIQFEIVQQKIGNDSRNYHYQHFKNAVVDGVDAQNTADQNSRKKKGLGNPDHLNKNVHQAGFHQIHYNICQKIHQHNASNHLRGVHRQHGSRLQTVDHKTANQSSCHVVAWDPQAAQGDQGSAVDSVIGALRCCDTGSISGSEFFRVLGHGFGLVIGQHCGSILTHGR